MSARCYVAWLSALWITATVGSGCTPAPPSPAADAPDSSTASAVAPTAHSDANGATSNRVDERITQRLLNPIPVTERAKQRALELTSGVNAATTAWRGESFVDAIAAPLRRLAELLESSQPVSAERLAAVASSRFQCSALRPEPLVDVHTGPHVVVRRSSARSPADPSGESTAIQRVQQLAAVLQGMSQASVKLKVVDVQMESQRVSTRIFAEGRGLRNSNVSQGTVQWTAHWQCRWEPNTAEDAPQLTSIDVEDYEEVISQLKSPRWLVDCSAGLFRDTPEFEQQFHVGMDGWVNRIEQRLRVNRLGHHGIAIGDVNGDGREDIYVCHSGGLPNRLFIQTPQGTLQDVSRTAGVDFLDDSTCALLIDLDNDGDQDLVVVTVAGGVVLSNEGKTHFKLRAHLSECRNAFSLTAADYDADGLLDLYVGRYWPDEEGRGEIPIPVPFFDAQNGGRNTLYRNMGWRFLDVTSEVGLDQDNTRYTMAAAWEDLDGDADLDLYLANDFGRNCWYRNDKGRFTNVAEQAGLEDIATGMSVSYADYDHDGHLDLYVGNMYSAAGNRVAYQRQYSNRFESTELTKVQRLARGNSLFRNRGDGRFEDVSLMAGVNMGRWAWGSIFTDLDNDSWDDLIVVNGHLTTSDSGDL